MCRARVAVLGRRRRERVLIPRYRFASVALEFAVGSDEGEAGLGLRSQEPSAML